MNPIELSQLETEICKELQCTKLLAKFLCTRGFSSVDQVKEFLDISIKKIPNPFEIFDMKKAVNRVRDAILQNEPILIYGDYDVDGTCGAAVLFDFLSQIGVTPKVFQPNRFTHGYGVHVEPIDQFCREGVKVIVTVDCGITSVQPALVAKEHGVDFIVVDHHKVGAELPKAFAIVDPQRIEDKSGLKNLCGAGLAFFFVIGLRASLRDAGFFENRKEPNLFSLLDLVAVASVADMVDLRGVNRILVSYGLNVLRQKPRVGFKALLDVAQTKRVSTVEIGFVLGPRINAAGRLESASAAFDLVSCQDYSKVFSLAENLNELNKKRKETQEETVEMALEQAQLELLDRSVFWKEGFWKKLSDQIPSAQFGPWPRILVLSPEDDQDWHEGVVGIVASRIMNELNLPVVVLSNKQTDKGLLLKGSIRSLPKIDIIEAIQQCAKEYPGLLENFGGHAHAGGVSLKKENLLRFVEAINKVLAIRCTSEHYQKENRFDLEIDMKDLSAFVSQRFLGELEALEPFGMGFPEPVFKIRNPVFSDARYLKEKHLKFKLGGVDAIWFSAAEKFSDQNPPTDIWVTPQKNEWNGTKRLQFQVLFGLSENQ
ncbi:MAG: single-stranded-DNA-specific exonuclease RecJ [Bacteriovoracia bacterium]